jgi:hypothetical protein
MKARNNINRTIRSSLLLVLAAVVTPLFWSTGCGSGDKTASPQKMEEHRQEHMKRAERARREG